MGVDLLACQDELMQEGALTGKRSWGLLFWTTLYIPYAKSVRVQKTDSEIYSITDLPLNTHCIVYCRPVSNVADLTGSLMSCGC